jgi:hypothetical protein
LRLTRKTGGKTISNFVPHRPGLIWWNRGLQYAAMAEKINDSGFDLAGLGKVANAIPPEVYTRTTESIVATFEKLVAPITETTGGAGRFIRQKFDSMIEIEKALATLATEKAVRAADNRAKARRTKPRRPAHPKSFVRCMEEASKETDACLHDMWSGLMASQMDEAGPHPHFIEILSNFSPKEARLLASLRPVEEIGENEGSGLFFGEETYLHWLFSSEDNQPKEWDLSCQLLKSFGLAFTAIPPKKDEDSVTILYRTRKGEKLLALTSLE